VRLSAALIALGAMGALTACRPVPSPEPTGGWIGVLVQPDPIVVPTGREIQLSATGLTADRQSDDVTAIAVWESSDPDVADVSDGLDEEGLLRAQRAGHTTVRATVDGVVSPWIDVDVTEAALLSLSLSPSPLDVAVGAEAQLTALATFSDGLTTDAARQVRWIVEDGGVAVVSKQGVVTGLAEGQTQIGVRWDDVTSTPIDVRVQRGAAQLRVDAIERTATGVRVDVSNVGAVGVSSTWLDVYVNPALPPVAGDLGDAFVSIEDLEPGEARSVTLDLSLPAGQPEVLAFIDSLDTLEERDEADNQLSARLEAGVDALPDLAVYDVHSDAYDGFVLHTVTVVNLSDAPSPAFSLEAWADRSSAPSRGAVADEEVTVSGLAPFEERDVTLILDAACTSCDAWFWVDRDDVVAELDAYDNLAGPFSTAWEELGDSGWWDTAW
jgi:hypothetical protein